MVYSGRLFRNTTALTPEHLEEKKVLDWTTDMMKRLHLGWLLSRPGTGHKHRPHAIPGACVALCARGLDDDVYVPDDGPGRPAPPPILRLMAALAGWKGAVKHFPGKRFPSRHGSLYLFFLLLHGV